MDKSSALNVTVLLLSVMCMFAPEASVTVPAFARLSELKLIVAVSAALASWLAAKLYSSP
jgi:hypothetical protein